MLLSINREGNDRSFKTLPAWAQQMFRHLHAKGVLFEVWSPICNHGRGSWEVRKQPSPAVFNKDRHYRLYTRDNVHIHLGVSNIHPVRYVKMSSITAIDNKIVVGVEENTAYIMNLEIVK